MQLLDSVLEMGAADLVSASQWPAVLAAVSSCCALGRRLPPAAAAASPATTNNSSTGAARVASRKKRPLQSAVRRKEPSNGAPVPPPAPLPKRASAPDLRQAFLLACKALVAMQQMYEAAEGSAQTGELYLALIAAIKTTVRAATKAADAGACVADAATVLQWMPTVPLDMATLAQLSEPSTAGAAPGPCVFLHTHLFHMSRLLNYMQQTLPECWAYFGEEMMADVVQHTLDLLPTLLLVPRAASAATAAASPAPAPAQPQPVRNNLLWCVSAMADTRFLWLRRWMGQQAVRSLWHGAARRHLEWGLALDELVRSSRLHALSFAQQHQHGAAASAAAVAAADSVAPAAPAHPMLLSISRTEVASLGCTAAFALLLEHTSSWLAPAPAPAPAHSGPDLSRASVPSPSPSLVAAPASASSSASSSQHRSKSKKKDAPGGKEKAAMQKSSGQQHHNRHVSISVSFAGAETESALQQQHVESMLSLAELSVHLLCQAALTPSAAESGDPSPPPTVAPQQHRSQPLLATRCRLTLLSSAQHFLAQALVGPAMGSDAAIALLQQLLQPFLALLRPDAAAAASRLLERSGAFLARAHPGPASSPSPLPTVQTPKPKTGPSSANAAQRLAARKSLGGPHAEQAPAHRGSAAAERRRSMLDAASMQAALLSASSASAPAPAAASILTPIPAAGLSSAALSLVQQAALTSAIGLCAVFGQHSPRNLARLVLVRDLGLDPSASGTGTGVGERAADLDLDPDRARDNSSVSLLQLICIVLGLDDGADAVGSSGTARRFVFSPHVAAAGATGATNSTELQLQLPSVLESMLLDLLRRCIPAAQHPSSHDRDRAAQARYLRNLAERILQLVAALPPSLAAAPACDAPPASGADDDTRPAHQQSTQIATLMDLLFHWTWSVPRAHQHSVAPLPIAGGFVCFCFFFPFFFFLLLIFSSFVFPPFLQLQLPRCLGHAARIAPADGCTVLPALCAAATNAVARHALSAVVRRLCGQFRRR